MKFLESYHNFIGIFGVVLVLLAYCFMQLGQIRHDSVCFSAVNSLGSLFILVSLYFDRNLASIIIEVSWLVISLLGTILAVLRVKKTVNSQ
jgi:hypothetical protein